MEFNVSDMSCSKCAARIEKAIHTVDPQAHVEADVDAKRISVTSTAAQDVIVKAVSEAGYTATPAG